MYVVYDRGCFCSLFKRGERTTEERVVLEVAIMVVETHRGLVDGEGRARLQAKSG